MSRRRKPWTPRLEPLESRVVLAGGGTISVQAPNRDISTVAPAGGTPAQAEFDITFAMSGDLYPVYVTYTETVTPTDAALPPMSFSDGSPATSGGFIYWTGSPSTYVIKVGPTPTFNNVDEKVTLTLSSVRGCGNSNWTLGNSQATITFHLPAENRVTPFCPDTPPLALTESPGTGVDTPPPDLRRGGGLRERRGQPEVALAAGVRRIRLDPPRRQPRMDQRPRDRRRHDAQFRRRRVDLRDRDGQP